MVTGVREEIPYCSFGTLSGEQSKACSTSQPQFCSEHTPATNDVDQVLLALQQLVTNSNSSIFNNNNGISKLPKSLTKSLPTFGGKSEKFELFEDMFQASLKIHNQRMEEDRINYFHSLMRGDALQLFKNITSLNRENLGEILTVFRRKYVKPQSMARTKLKYRRLVFNPANQKIISSRRTPQTSKRCIRSCNSGSHGAIHIFQNASPPEEIDYSGACGEWHI